MEEVVNANAEITIELVLKQVKGAKKEEESSSVLEIFTNPIYLYRFITMGFTCSGIYAVFYGLSTDVSSLGIENICVVGVFLGITQTIGYIIVIPFISKMKRAKWMRIFCTLIILGAFVLLALSFFDPSNQYINYTKAGISTIVLATFMSAAFPFLFLMNTELFPTEVRGTASALVLSCGKLVGASAPFIGDFCKNFGIHPLVGCSVPFLVAIPMLLFIKETLNSADADLERISQKFSRMDLITPRESRNIMANIGDIYTSMGVGMIDEDSTLHNDSGDLKNTLVENEQ